MTHRISTALVVWLGLWLWTADGTAADSMSGGGVSSSGSQPWTGLHNNVPSATLSPVGTVFTPPSSFGNWSILNNAGGQSVACVPDIASGDSMDFVIQQGPASPYSPALTFASCYGTSNGSGLTISATPGAEDDFFCFAKNPPINGTSFTCAPQLNVKTSAPPPPAIVQTVPASGGATGTTALGGTLNGFGAGHAVVIAVGWCGTNTCTGNGAENITSVTTTGGTCGLIPGTATGVSVPLPVALYHCSASGSSIAFAANWGANAFFQKVAAMEISNDVTGSEAGNANNGNSAAPTVTSGTLTQSSKELVIAFSFAFNNATGVNSPFTFIDLGGQAVGYFSTVSCSSCTQPVTFTSGSGTWSADIAGIMHQ